MSKFSDLKTKNSDIDRLIGEIDKINNKKFDKVEDTRFWQPTVDKAGNGYAVIRFLPAPEVDGDDSLPWVRIWNHAFQGPSGSWYIENSLTTLGQRDFVTEENNKLWNSGVEADKKLASQRKRKLTYIANVYIVEDSDHPENVGTVRLYRFGKKIFDKINEAMNPQFADEKPMNPFDLWKGANFKLKIRMKDDFRNYDKAEFAAVAPLLDDDKKLEEVYKKEYSLKEFLDPSNFKSYDELKNRYLAVVGGDASATSATSTIAVPKAAMEAEESDEEEEKTLKYFESLAKAS